MRAILTTAFLLGLLIAAADLHAAEPLPAGVKKVEPEHLVNYWLVSATDGADVPNSGFNLNAPSCAAVSYVIEKNGTTSHIKLERIVPEGDLGKVAVSAVRGLRYSIGAANSAKDAVYTYIVWPFNLVPEKSATPAELAERKRILAACKLDDFKLPAN